VLSYSGAHLLDSNEIRKYIRNISRCRSVQVQLVGYSNDQELNWVH